MWHLSSLHTFHVYPSVKSYTRPLDWEHLLGQWNNITDNDIHLERTTPCMSPQRKIQITACKDDLPAALYPHHQYPVWRDTRSTKSDFVRHHTMRNQSEYPDKVSCIETQKNDFAYEEHPNRRVEYRFSAYGTEEYARKCVYVMSESCKKDKPTRSDSFP
jgi:hypothetical protein